MESVEWKGNGMGRVDKSLKAKSTDRDGRHTEPPSASTFKLTDAKKEPDWIARSISILALVFAVPSTLLAFNQYLTSFPGVELVHVGTPTLRAIGAATDVYLTGTYQSVLVNKSSQAASIVGMDCFVTIEDHANRSDSCEVTGVESGKSNWAINLDAYGAAQVSIEFRISADEDVQNLYKEFMKERAQFNETQFLLYLGSKSTDFFGSRFDGPYNYLQLTFGENLCLGGKIAIRVHRSPSDDPLEKDVEFYVGPFPPTVECKNDVNRSGPLTILHSDYYGESDRFDGSPGPRILSNN